LVTDEQQHAKGCRPKHFCFHSSLCGNQIAVAIRKLIVPREQNLSPFGENRACRNSALEPATRVSRDRSTAAQHQPTRSHQYTSERSWRADLFLVRSFMKQSLRKGKNNRRNIPLRQGCIKFGFRDGAGSPARGWPGLVHCLEGQCECNVRPVCHDC